ncbi:MAG: hypothetical protein J1F33_06920 [Clostridiales bacterium]|nr:hypothetical protein [Clostridiales bacterium]
MEEKVIVKSERRVSNTVLFIGCVFAIVGLGLTIAYCSGIFRGVQYIQRTPFVVPDWLVIALPPVLFLHQAIAMFLTLRQNVYSSELRSVRKATWVFQVLLFFTLAFLPYFVWGGMMTGAFAVATIASALALGSTILTYRQTVGGGVWMTILFIVSALITLYIGYWAFA